MRLGNGSTCGDWLGIFRIPVGMVCRIRVIESYAPTEEA